MNRYSFCLVIFSSIFTLDIYIPQFYDSLYEHWSFAFELLAWFFRYSCLSCELSQWSVTTWKEPRLEWEDAIVLPFSLYVSPPPNLPNSINTTKHLKNLTGWLLSRFCFDLHSTSGWPPSALIQFHMLGHPSCFPLVKQLFKFCLTIWDLWRSKHNSQQFIGYRLYTRTNLCGNSDCKDHRKQSISSYSLLNYKHVTISFCVHYLAKEFKNSICKSTFYLAMSMQTETLRWSLSSHI